MNKKLEGKTALVVGGGTGIGLGIAQGLASHGCRLVLCGRRQEVLEQAAERCGGEPAVLTRRLDVTDRARVGELVDWFLDQLGRIDILVNSAGMNIKTRTMAEMTPEQWDEVLEVNATGAYNLMYHVLPAMRRQADGLILNVSSISGLRATALGGVAYSASKFAMAALSTAAANEERAHGIRITNIYPGEVNTPILDNRPQPVSQEHKAAILQPEDFGELMAAIAALPPRAHVPEIVIKPTRQAFM